MTSVNFSVFIVIIMVFIKNIDLINDDIDSIQQIYIWVDLEDVWGAFFVIDQ